MQFNAHYDAVDDAEQGIHVGCRRAERGASFCPRPHEHVALQDGHALDRHQLLAQFGERLRIERQLPAEGAERHAPMAPEVDVCGRRSGARMLEGLHPGKALPA